MKLLIFIIISIIIIVSLILFVLISFNLSSNEDKLMEKSKKDNKFGKYL
ncbi:MAG: hypothetical protein RR404_02415 [Bacilli bacterium]